MTKKERNANAYAKTKEKLMLADKLKSENTELKKQIEILEHENDVLRFVLDRLGQGV